MRVYLDSLGCRLNQSEIDRMASELRASGHRPVGSAAEADLVVINTCAVTREADRDSRQRLRQAHAHNPAARIVATGCWSTLAPGEAAALPGVHRVVGNAQKDDLVPLLGLPDSEPLPECDLEPIARVPLPGMRHRTRAFIKVQDGCDNRCTFCVTTVARGPGRSRTPAEVIADVRAAVAGGAKEAVLTGVHLGSYGHDFGHRHDLPDLVRLVLAQTDIPRLRLSSVEPWDIEPAFFELWRDPRLCRHLHLPLQSGCGATLKRMARRTTPESFHALVHAARTAVPAMAITTDLIVGFPGETEAEFAESLDFVRRMSFAGVHAFTFSARPGTAAARMGRTVSKPAKRERRKIVLEAVVESAWEYRRRFVGQTLPVLWEAAVGASEDGILWTGLADNGLRVTAPSQTEAWNTLTPATITGTVEDGLIARSLP